MKRNELTINDLIRLAKTKPATKDSIVSDLSDTGAITMWVQELQISSGTKKVKAADMYTEFKNYCAAKRRVNIPNRTKFGMFLNNVLLKKRTSKGNFYLINYTAAELRERRDKKEN